MLTATPRITAPVLPAGLTPEQLQAVIDFMVQNRLLPAAPGTPSPSSSSTLRSSSGSAEAQPQAEARQPAVNVAMGASVAFAPRPPSPTRTPPPTSRISSPPPTPRTPARSKAKGSLLTMAALTPASKMAQLTLGGKRLPSTPSPRKSRAGAKGSGLKGPLPTGYDPALVFENVASSSDNNPAKPSAPVKSDNAAADADNSDPYKGFPEVVTAPPQPTPADDKMDVDTPKRARPKKNHPTMKRWIKTRRSCPDSETSPPPVERSPRKKARISSSAADSTVAPAPLANPAPVDPAPTAPTDPFRDVSSASTAPTTVGPDPAGASSGATATAEHPLKSGSDGAKVPRAPRLVKPAPRADFVDDEAEEELGADDGTDEDQDLEDFVVADNVIEFDSDAASLPDDDDHKPLKRLHRRTRSTAEDGNEDDDDQSDIVIVAKVDKGKGRADPLPSTAMGTTQEAGPSSAAASPDQKIDLTWQTKARTLSRVINGLYPGSSPVAARANVCARLQIDMDSLFDFSAYRCEFLDSIGFYFGVAPVPSGFSLFLSNYNERGWGTPSLEVVAAAETHIHLRNLKTGLRFIRQGPFVNEALVDPSAIDAVEVSPPGGTRRYKAVIRDTRAPAVAITGGIIRYSHLEEPTQGSLPVLYVCVTPYEGLFDRAVAYACTIFGQWELQCAAFNNAIRFVTLPAFERPPAPSSNSRVKTSSSIRGDSSSGTSSRRGVNFEPTPNDGVPVFDARSTKLPEDFSIWPTALPRFEGPIPKDAVAFIAHTTNMWVGTRSKTASSSTSYNLQYNLLFIVIIGVLPAGFV
ncbi:hypothetical protein EV715DRAFT_297436 [Schizophyllum commune]